MPVAVVFKSYFKQILEILMGKRNQRFSHRFYFVCFPFDIVTNLIPLFTGYFYNRYQKHKYYTHTRFIFLFDIEVDKSFNTTYKLEFICQKLELTII